MREATISQHGRHKYEVNQQSFVAKWFISEEFYWRSIASAVWSICIFQASIIFFMFAYEFTIFSPINSFFGWIKLLFTIRMVLSTICLQVLCFLVNKLHGRCLGVKPIIYRSTSSFIFHLLRPHQIASLILNILVCFTAGLVLQNSSSSRKSHGTHAFILLSGIFTGFFYTVGYYKENKNVVQFPIVNQKRFFRVKKTVLPTFKDAVFQSLKILKYYYPIYIMFGYLSRAIICWFSRYGEGSKLGVSLYNLCDLSLFWFLICQTTVLIFMMEINNRLLHIFNTQHYEFPVEIIRTEDAERTLMHAMKSESLLLKHLSYYDCYLSSKFPTKRRLKMFELTSPGNQPHCWNGIALETLRLIENLSSNMKTEITRKEHLKLKQKVHVSNTNTVGLQNLFSPVNSTATVRKRIDSKTDRSIQDSTTKASGSITTSAQPDEPDMELFSDFPILCWGIQGISNLVAASLVEDKYGVVQMKLPDILASILDLLEICECFTKVSLTPITPSTYQRNQVDHEILLNNNQCCSSLKIVLKTALYTITSSFGTNINAVRLSNSHSKRLNEFIQYND